MTHPIVKLSVLSNHLTRTFTCDPDGFRTDSFTSATPVANLIKTPSSTEGTITFNNHEYPIGGASSDSFTYESHSVKTLRDGGQKLEIIFAAPSPLPEGLIAKVIYEAPNIAPVLTKFIRIENEGETAVRLDDIMVETITPCVTPDMALMLENDYVRDGMMIDGKRARSPWIEGQEVYIEAILNTQEIPAVFAYPILMDRWLVAGSRFNSFKVYEFAITNKDRESRGLEFRKATRALLPATTRKWLNCGIAPSNNVQDYYEAVKRAAELGYEGLTLSHGWIDGNLTNPIFTNYNDYELRPELFPNGWDDVRKLTDYAHSLGLQMSTYFIYVNTWRDKGTPKADSQNQWELVWAEDDKSARWGITLDPGTDWGMFVNRKIEETMIRGGFDVYLLDGPYYGDISVAENRGYIPGGPNQLIGWERQIEFYQRMTAQGYQGLAAQGFQCFAHGCNRIGTTGYNEGDFGTLGAWQAIIAARSGAYNFTYLYRPEQAFTACIMVSWLGGPNLEPMEDHVAEYNAYLANEFGYGFEGGSFVHLPYDGPKSKAAVQRWLGFWKAHEAFFKQGYMLHLRAPNGTQIDAVIHVVEEASKKKALLVAYNPTEEALQDELSLDALKTIGYPTDGWTALSETGQSQQVALGKIKVSVEPQNATWYELDLS